MQHKPAVFAVSDTYQILVPVASPSLMWVRVGERCYYDHANGVMRSRCKVHHMTVPAAELDEAGAYTICERRIPHRRAYCSKPDPVVETAFPFYPVPQKDPRAYMIADAHNRVAEPVRAAKTFGDFDFLIFNGDVPDYSETIRSLMTVFILNDKLTGGTKPLLFTRGNHDLRGKYAEDYAQFAPSDNGRFFYTFRLGSVSGVLLDCGEDKPDDHPEYGGTICCHGFRKAQSAFLQSCVPDTDAQTRLVIVHSPFTTRYEPPFNIEEDLFASWAELLRTNVKPDVMLCGHLHRPGVHPRGSAFDCLGQPCTVVVGGKPGSGYYAGAGFTFRADGVEVVFTDSDGKTLLSQTIAKP